MRYLKNPVDLAKFPLYHGTEKIHSEIDLFINSSGTVRLVL